jgi:hypothetical protein
VAAIILPANAHRSSSRTFACCNCWGYHVASMTSAMRWQCDSKQQKNKNNKTDNKNNNIECEKINQTQHSPLNKG